MVKRMYKDQRKYDETIDRYMIRVVAPCWRMLLALIIVHYMDVSSYKSV